MQPVVMPVLLVLSSLLVACDDQPSARRAKREVSSALVDFAVPAAAARIETSREVRIEALRLESDLETFVLRGARGPDRIVFLHGLCGHGRGYLESFQHTAAAHGIAVSPNGDKPCDDSGRTWSHDLEAIQAHIDDSFAAAGARAPRGITAIGYSLGASRAEALARKYPDRYDAIVLIAAPTQPSPAKLGHLRAAAMMAGTRDRQTNMRAATTSFSRAGIASEFFELPGAVHGQMGDEPERTMGAVLDWLESQPVE